jgi:hypothetical protein|tara:strand:- start:4392 stop:4769 length:378 start_codon:yes stop_codon:yes gene_type:complete
MPSRRSLLKGILSLPIAAAVAPSAAIATVEDVIDLSKVIDDSSKVDLDIDYHKLRIFIKNKGICSGRAVYGCLQDIFYEPEQMDDEVPMAAMTPTHFKMINGWKIVNPEMITCRVPAPVIGLVNP